MHIDKAFVLGGWGMWPTLGFGVLMIAAAAWYAVWPGRQLPLVLSCGFVTLLSGGLGFTSGVISTLLHQETAGPAERHFALVGVGESLYNVLFALALMLVATLVVGVGAWRIARGPAASPHA